METRQDLLDLKSGNRVVWTGAVREDPSALDVPRWWRKPRKVFVNSMNDLFQPSVSEKFIREVWHVMRGTPHHNYQILTKTLSDSLRMWPDS